MEILKISRRIRATVQLEASHKERHEELTAHHGSEKCCEMLSSKKTEIFFRKLVCGSRIVVGFKKHTHCHNWKLRFLQLDELNALLDLYKQRLSTFYKGKLD